VFTAVVLFFILLGAIVYIQGSRAERRQRQHKLDLIRQKIQNNKHKKFIEEHQKK
jgi:preprotein translocase subunit YajC